ncbi:MAG: 4-hydroxyphenylpyruvate dioxygenase [Gammaproteobacteria bacterium]
MMSQVYDNPMGTDGFEFVEYAAPDPKLLHTLFRNMGFSPVAKHRKRAITLYRQNNINFLVNEEPDSFAADFAKKHGPCAVGFAVRVKDRKKAFSLALDKGAMKITHKPGSLALDTAMIKGIGGSILYMVDGYDKGDVYAAEYDYAKGVDRHPKGVGLTYIDHLTHNVNQGEMNTWAGYYERLFNFHEIRYFDIKGTKTGLFSRAMTSPDGKVRIPLNESADDKSQIAEYLRQYHGEGIQHVALFTENIYDTVETMKRNQVEFLDTPDAYYEMVDERVPNHGEDLARMRKNKILIDADMEDRSKQLLQIFTQNCIGPIFFEIIQRKGNEGFGEGNFRALFLAIERDQMKRGVL